MGNSFRCMKVSSNDTFRNTTKKETKLVTPVTPTVVSFDKEEIPYTRKISTSSSSLKRSSKISPSHLALNVDSCKQEIPDYPATPRFCPPPPPPLDIQKILAAFSTPVNKQHLIAVQKVEQCSVNLRIPRCRLLNRQSSHLAMQKFLHRKNYPRIEEISSKYRVINQKENRYHLTAQMTNNDHFDCQMIIKFSERSETVIVESGTTAIYLFDYNGLPLRISVKRHGIERHTFINQVYKNDTTCTVVNNDMYTLVVNCESMDINHNTS